MAMTELEMFHKEAGAVERLVTSDTCEFLVDLMVLENVSVTT